MLHCWGIACTVQASDIILGSQLAYANLLEHKAVFMFTAAAVRW